MVHALIAILMVSLIAAMAFGGEKAPALAPKAADLLKQGDLMFGSRKYAEATAIFEKAVKAAESEGDKSALVEALAMTARGHLIRDLKDEGRPWIDRATAVAKPDDPAGWSRYLGVRGRFEWQDDDKAKATKTFEEMYAYCLKHELHSRAVDAAHMVAITGSVEQQIEWGTKGIEAAEKGGMDGWLGPLWNNLGNTYQDAGRFEDAVEAFLKAREYHWKVGAEINKLIADWAVGMAYRRAGDAKKAIVWIRPVLAWSERRYAEEQTPDTAEWVGFSHREMGEIAAMNGKTAEALDHLKKAKKHLTEAKMQEWDEKGFKELDGRIATLAGG
jgi:tetratricopeptide (TPR) repeat protein